jgi:hypothetical protein
MIATVKKSLKKCAFSKNVPRGVKRKTPRAAAITNPNPNYDFYLFKEGNYS